MLICPVCRSRLLFENKTAFCCNGHRFDIAKEGYVNLLRSSKSGDRIGDDKLSARSRRDFLNKGYYQSLKDGLIGLLKESQGNLIDICCGEGYYTEHIGRETTLQVYGFDISKEMVRLGAKRGGAMFFVANMAHIPVNDASFDYAIHLFAPFQEQEFYRILKPGGTLYTVIPGSRHLFDLKMAIYDTPYLNDEKLPDTEKFKFKAIHKFCDRILLSSKEDIEAVFRMTPYYFHTAQKDKEKLYKLDALETQVEFVVGEFVKD